MIDLDAAYTHFLTADPLLASLLQRYRNDTTKPLRVPQKVSPILYPQQLYRSIVSQQISTKAAAKIYTRFLEMVGDTSIPGNILRNDIEQLRSVGLSRQKATYIQSIAQHAADGSVDFAHLDSYDDHTVINQLITIKGVGRWTAEMFLIFTLARQDVFSCGDLGLLNASRQHWNDINITPQILETRSMVWSPHRSTAALILWHSLDNNV